MRVKIDLDTARIWENRGCLLNGKREIQFAIPVAIPRNVREWLCTVRADNTCLSVGAYTVKLEELAREGEDEDETMRARQLLLDFLPICRVYCWPLRSNDRVDFVDSRRFETISVRSEINILEIKERSNLYLSKG